MLARIVRGVASNHRGRAGGLVGKSAQATHQALRVAELSCGANCTLQLPIATGSQCWRALSSQATQGVVRNREARPAAMEVVILGDPVLREVCTACGNEPLEAEKASLVRTLLSFRAANGFGRGIAAPQIGITRRFIAIHMGVEPRVLTDPVITRRSEKTFTMFDDCMSIPSLLVKVTRHHSVDVSFTNEQGITENWENCDQATSELLQHEIDHLDGRLIVDIAEDKGIIARDEFEKHRALYEGSVDYVIEATV